MAEDMKHDSWTASDMEVPRASTETERHGVFDDSATATSAAPSTRAPSISSLDDGDRTPRAGSPAPSVNSQATSVTLVSRSGSIDDDSSRSYKGFPSEEAYLAALRAWADDKKYLHPTEETYTLTGWYGTKTMGEYLDGLEKPPEFSLLKKWKERKAVKKQEKANKRRASAAA